MPKAAQTAAKQSKTPPKGTRVGFVRASDAARRLGLTAQAIGQWAAKADAPVEKDATAVWLRWPAFARWREQELAKQAAAEATTALRQQIDALTNEGGGSARTRIERASAIMSELDVAERLGTLIPVAEAAAITEKLCTDLRQQLLAFPRRWAPTLVGVTTVVEMERRLDQAMVRTLQAISASDTAAMDTNSAKAA